MNNLIITTMCLVVLTGCAGYYSQYQQYPNQQEYTFENEDRDFDLSQVNEEEDVGSQEISFEQ